MGEQVTIELRAKSQFWANAFSVEWEDQFPERTLDARGAGIFVVDSAWVADIERVAKQTSCEAFRAPSNPARRSWIKLLGLRSTT